MKLTATQRQAVIDAINNVFYSLQARLVGRFFGGPRIYFKIAQESDPLDTLEGLYRYTISILYGPDAKPTEDNLKTLAETASNYIEARRLQTINRVFKAIDAAKNVNDAFKKIRHELNKVTNTTHVLVSSEASFTRAYAEKEGIGHLAASVGDDDPTVVLLGRFDEKTCKYCRAMYHDPKYPGKPIPYKLSELKSDYFSPKNWDNRTAHSPPLHPNCRHIMSYVPLNMGFDNSGQIVFKYVGYDYYKDYHSINKHELDLIFSDLEKCTC